MLTVSPPYMVLLLPLQVEGGVGDGREGVEVRWERKEVEDPQDVDGEVTYSVHVFEEDKPECKEIYR